MGCSPNRASLRGCSAPVVEDAVDHAAKALRSDGRTGARAHCWGVNGQICVVEQPPSTAISCPVM
jgi:hypothetical protein